VAANAEHLQGKHLSTANEDDIPLFKFYMDGTIKPRNAAAEMLIKSADDKERASLNATRKRQRVAAERAVARMLNN